MKNRRMIVISALLLYAIVVVACLLMEAKGRAEPVIDCEPAMGRMFIDLDFKVCKGTFIINDAKCADPNTQTCQGCRIVVSNYDNGRERCYAIQCPIRKNSEGQNLPPTQINHKICVKETGQTCNMNDVKDIDCGINCRMEECGDVQNGQCTSCNCNLTGGVPITIQKQVNTCSTN